MKPEILDPPSSLSSSEVNLSMEPSHPSVRSARRWRISLPVWLGVILILASLGVAAVSIRTHASHDTPSPSISPTPSDERRWYSLGYVDIEGGITPIYPVQPGRVEKIDVREDQDVKAGTPLFRLEDRIPLLKVREAEDAVQIAQNQLSVAEAEAATLDEQIAAQKLAIETAQKDVDRARNVRDEKRKYKDEGLGGKTEAKDAEILFEKAELGVRFELQKLKALESGKRKTQGYIAVARENIKAKQDLRDEAQNAVNECVVRAPCDGTPLRILIDVGQVLGNNPRQPAIQFAARRALLVRAEVEQEFVGHVRKEQSVVIEDHITGQDCAAGKVVSIARWYAPRRTASPELLQMNNDVRTLECIIKIESTVQEVRIGQRVRVRFPD
jgi:multidrug resistance efflux pump